MYLLDLNIRSNFVETFENFFNDAIQLIWTNHQNVDLFTFVWVFQVSQILKKQLCKEVCTNPTYFYFSQKTKVGCLQKIVWRGLHCVNFQYELKCFNIWLFIFQKKEEGRDKHTKVRDYKRKIKECLYNQS